MGTIERIKRLLFYRIVVSFLPLIVMFVLTLGGAINSVKASFPGDSMSLYILWSQQYNRVKNSEVLSKIDQVGLLLQSSPEIAKKVVELVNDYQKQGIVGGELQDLRKEVIFEFLSSKYIYSNIYPSTREINSEQGFFVGIKKALGLSNDDSESRKVSFEDEKFLRPHVVPYVYNNIVDFDKPQADAIIMLLGNILGPDEFEMIFDASSEDRSRMIAEILRDYYFDDGVDNTQRSAVGSILMVPFF